MFLKLLQGEKQRCKVSTTDRTPTPHKNMCALHTPPSKAGKLTSKGLRFHQRHICTYTCSAKYPAAQIFEFPYRFKKTKVQTASSTVHICRYSNIYSCRSFLAYMYLNVLIKAQLSEPLPNEGIQIAWPLDPSLDNFLL